MWDTCGYRIFTARKNLRRIGALQPAERKARRTTFWTVGINLRTGDAVPTLRAIGLIEELNKTLRALADTNHLMAISFKNEIRVDIY